MVATPPPLNLSGSALVVGMSVWVVPLWMCAACVLLAITCWMDSASPSVLNNTLGIPSPTDARVASHPATPAPRLNAYHVVLTSSRGDCVWALMNATMAPTRPSRTCNASCAYLHVCNAPPSASAHSVKMNYICMRVNASTHAHLGMWVWMVSVRGASHPATSVKEMSLIAVDVRMVFCMRGNAWWIVPPPPISGLRGWVVGAVLVRVWIALPRDVFHVWKDTSSTKANNHAYQSSNAGS